MPTATSRRLLQELGLHCALHFLYKFEYQANFGDQGSEHELCSVYLGRSDETVVANLNEVEDWRFVEPAQLEQEMQRADRAIHSLVQDGVAGSPKAATATCLGWRQGS